MSEIDYMKKRSAYLPAYEQAVGRVEALLVAGKLERALRHAEYAASIAWHRPILTEFVDERLEGLIERLATQLVQKHPFVAQKNAEHCKRAVLYNGQIIDTGALTEQYLNYLVEEGCEVLFVVQDARYTAAGRKILQRLSQLDQVKVLLLESGSRRRKIKQLHQAVIDFDPDCSFLHFLPNDVVGFAAFSTLTGRPRYYIVHNDHTFWLGKGCSDYFLEFRQLGVRMAIERRGIDEGKIINLPYYPIKSGVAFQGFPFDASDKVVGLSGAILGKYFRDPKLKYFHGIRRLLNAHSNFVFCLCGAGSVEQVKLLNGFIAKYDLKERFYYLGNRVDFYELVGRVDILFESYPQRGGLTVLFATNQGRAVVGLGTKEPYPGTTEQYLDIEKYQQPTDMDSFEREAARLIEDEECRMQNARLFGKNKYNKQEFTLKLSKLIRAGFDYRDELNFNQEVMAPTAEMYRLLFHSGMCKKEFLLRARTRAFIDSALWGSICNALISLHFGGLGELLARLRRKLARKV